MSYRDIKTVKVALPSNPDYWVEIKVDLPYGEIKDYSQYGGTGDSLTIGERLKKSIVGWNIDDDKGNVLDITVENIDLLKEADVVTLAETVVESKGDQVKKN